MKTCTKCGKEYPASGGIPLQEIEGQGEQMEVNMAGQLLTAPEVAQRLRVSRPTLSRYLHRGVLPGSIQLPGGAWRIPAKAVADLLGETTVTES